MSTLEVRLLNFVRTSSNLLLNECQVARDIASSGKYSSSHHKWLCAVSEQSGSAENRFFIHFPVLLTLRIYALYGCSRRILAFMLGSGMVLLAISSVSTLYFVQPLVTFQPFCLVVTIRAKNCGSSTCCWLSYRSGV